MERATPPPDFRYVGLEPGPSGASTALTSIGVGVGVAAAGVVVSGGATDVPVLAGAAVTGAVTAWMVSRRLAPRLTSGLVRQVSMAIVPWGVLVQEGPMARVLRWAAVRDVNVDFVHEMDNATPSTRWSVVTVDTDRERLSGRTFGTASLERLQAHLEHYASEASSPVALDVDGTVAADELGFDPVFEQVLAEARRQLRTGELNERLFLVSSGYRESTPPRPTDRTVDELRRILAGSADTPADPRPMAAVLAVELGATELVDVIATLAASPHPLVAAVARAATLRLGGSVRKVGALAELVEFLPGADTEHIETWLASDRVHPCELEQRPSRLGLSRPALGT